MGLKKGGGDHCVRRDPEEGGIPSLMVLRAGRVWSSEGLRFLAASPFRGVDGLRNVWKAAF